MYNVTLFVNRLSSVLYDHSVDISFVNKVMRHSSVRWDHSIEMSLYTRFLVDVIDQ